MKAGVVLNGRVGLNAGSGSPMRVVAMCVGTRDLVTACEHAAAAPNSHLIVSQCSSVTSLGPGMGTIGDRKWQQNFKLICYALVVQCRSEQIN